MLYNHGFEPAACNERTLYSRNERLYRLHGEHFVFVELRLPCGSRPKRRERNTCISLQCLRLHPPTPPSPLSPPQVLLTAFQAKTSAAGSIPPSLQERFDGLVRDAAHTIRSGAVIASAQAATERVASNLHLTVANVEALAGVFDTEVGVQVENEALCCFMRLATTAACGG